MMIHMMVYTLYIMVEFNANRQPPNDVVCNAISLDIPLIGVRDDGAMWSDEWNIKTQQGTTPLCELMSFLQMHSELRLSQLHFVEKHKQRWEITSAKHS